MALDSHSKNVSTHNLPSDDDLHKVLSIKKLTDSTFILRFERKNLEFKAGQHVGVGPDNELSAREYSLYSGEKNEYLEILVKEVLDGMISPKLAKLREGDYVEVDNPVGSFSLNEDLPKDKKHIFIGTGTGIAPYSSFVKTHYLKNYIVIHGVKTVEEAYGIDVFDRRKYIICTSQNESGDFNGRVTNFIKQKPYEKDASYYLCGNSNMIHEMLGILDEQGINRGNIFTEVYF